MRGEEEEDGGLVLSALFLLRRLSCQTFWQSPFGSVKPSIKWGNWLESEHCHMQWSCCLGSRDNRNCRCCSANSGLPDMLPFHLGPCIQIRPDLNLTYSGAHRVHRGANTSAKLQSLWMEEGGRGEWWTPKATNKQSMLALVEAFQCFAHVSRQLPINILLLYVRVLQLQSQLIVEWFNFRGFPDGFNGTWVHEGAPSSISTLSHSSFSARDFALSPCWLNLGEFLLGPFLS